MAVDGEMEIRRDQVNTLKNAHLLILADSFGVAVLLTNQVADSAKVSKKYFNNKW